MPEILVKLEVSPFRRWVAVVMLLGLGALLLYIAAVFPPTKPVPLLGLILFGSAALWSGTKLYRATSDSLILTREGISTGSGVIVCKIDEVASVDRGFFAFKPSNGFLVRLRKSGSRHWSPGLWWRMGKNIGIGGATSRRQGKEMAEILAYLLSEKSSDK